MTIRLALAFAVGFALPAASQTLDLAQTRRIDSVFASFDGTNRPGCALGVSQAGTPVYLRGYGMSDLQNGVPISPRSIFHVASVSKQFAAFAVALLAQDGKLSLDDEVRKHVPELPDYGRKVTVRHLIYHTSGVRDQWELLGMAGWRYPDDLFTQDDVLDIVKRQKALNFNPGDEYVYSNSGYTLLAIIVQRVSGKTLREFSDERIFRPLGMTRTHVHDDHSMIVVGRTSAYQMGRDGWRISIPVFDTHGATSLFTTVEDLLKWQQNFETATVGSKALLAEAETSAVLNNGKPANYGFGISIENYRGTPGFGHGGADAGYRADVIRFPKHGLAVSVACNFADATPNAYSRAVAGILLDGKLEPEPIPTKPSGTVAISAARLNQVAGIYKSPVSDQAYRLAVRDGTLWLQNFNVSLAPLDDSRFTALGVIAQFDGPPNALPVSMKLVQGRTVFDSMPRMPAFTPDSTRLGEFLGDFWSDELRVSYQVERGDSGLVLRRFKHGTQSLSPIYQDTFVGIGGGGAGTVRFTRVKGKIAGFRLTGGRVRNVEFSKGVARP